MATTFNGSQLERGIQSLVWTLGNADNGQSIPAVRLADKTVQIAGTFGGATITLQGSNDDTNWETLNDADGVAIAKTASFLGLIRENPKSIRAISSGGTGTAVTVTVVAKQVT